MRLLLLPLFLLGVSCIRILDQASILSADDPTTDVTWDSGDCHYTEQPGDQTQYCPACRPPDGNPTYPVDYIPQDGSLCMAFRQWVACPNSQLCTPDDWPASCQATWSGWSDCDATCGGGQQWQQRSLPLQCMSCHSCDMEYQSCNTQPCGRDCVIGDWGPWGPCSISCLPYAPVLATQTRTRAMQQGQAPGTLCDPSEAIDVRSCQDPKPPVCAINCNVSEWSSWTDCSATCGCGVTHRDRTVVTQPNAYGSMCPHLDEEEPCQCSDCPQSCEMSEWSVGPCMGNCYDNYTDADGEQVLEYPQMRRTRYIVQEGKGGEPACSNPCGLTEEVNCYNLPPCPGHCELNPWGNWTGDCPICVPYGQPVPIQTRDRANATVADGSCGCTRQERVCDVPWCCDTCEVSSWSDWGPCIGYGGCPDTSGYQTRRRGIVRPPCPQNDCPDLDDRQDCSICCPIDCQVSPWAGWLPGAANQCAKENDDGSPGSPIPCGPTTGVIKYTRAILVQPNSCGLPCGDTAQEMECYPPSPCCPVNCTLGPFEYSPCFGCGDNAIRFRKQIIINRESCGGIPCCPPDGSALFRPDFCDNPPPCPQNTCTYTQWGEYGACPGSCRDTTPNYQCALRYLDPTVGVNPQDCPGNLTDCRECNTNCCPIDCVVGAWGPWSVPQPSCGEQVFMRTRTMITPAGCHGAPCPPTMEHNTTFTKCPVDCVVDEWGSWSLCKGCLAQDELPGSSIRTRAILVQPDGGDSCPDLIQSNTCPNTTCDVDCVVGEWSDWGSCSVICGDGYQLRSRNISTSPVGAGLACPPLTETLYCFQPCENCVLGPWEYGPCTPTCSNEPNATGLRRATRDATPLVQVLPDGTTVTLTMCPPENNLDTCSIPCCPVDCVMTPWGDWGDCIDGVMNRTRTVATYSSCHGADCPECLLEMDVCNFKLPDNECEFGEACEEGFSEDNSS